MQPCKACCMACDRAAFSSSVPLGIANTADTALKASVSRCITSRNRCSRSRAFSRVSRARPSNSAYFFLPTVKDPTMAVRAAPRAPASAAADPPPGAGPQSPVPSVQKAA